MPTLLYRNTGGMGTRTDNKESAWLIQFLRHGYSKGVERLEKPVHIYILDSINGILGSSSFTAHRKTPVEPAFLETLHSSSLQRRTRLIMLQCERLNGVNELYIDAIGLRYRLDPHFFSAVFDRCLIWTEGRRGLRYNSTALPPSERQFMQIVTPSMGHMAVPWKVTEEECTCE
jgi:hypothetical protein